MSTIYSGKRGCLGINLNGDHVYFGRVLNIGESVFVKGLNATGTIAEVIRTKTQPDEVALYKVVCNNEFIYEHCAGLEPICNTK